MDPRLWIDAKFTLKQEDLEDFKAFCEERNIETRPGRGAYRVLQVFVPEKNMYGVLLRRDSTEFLTIGKALFPLVRLYLSLRGKQL